MGHQFEVVSERFRDYSFAAEVVSLLFLLGYDGIYQGLEDDIENDGGIDVTIQPLYGRVVVTIQPFYVTHHTSSNLSLYGSIM